MRPEVAGLRRRDRAGVPALVDWEQLLVDDPVEFFSLDGGYHQYEMGKLPEPVRLSQFSCGSASRSRED